MIGKCFRVCQISKNVLIIQKKALKLSSYQKNKYFNFSKFFKGKTNLGRVERKTNLGRVERKTNLEELKGREVEPVIQHKINIC